MLSVIYASIAIKFIMLSVLKLSVLILSVLMLSVIMLDFAMLIAVAPVLTVKKPSRLFLSAV